MENITKFEEIIAGIDNLINKGVSASSTDFRSWRSKTERFLRKYYGDNSYEVNEFKKLHFSLTAFWGGTPHYEFVEACKKDLEICKSMFGEYLSEMREEENIHNLTPNEDYNTDNYSKIFIVHGHDKALKLSFYPNKLIKAKQLLKNLRNTATSVVQSAYLPRMIQVSQIRRQTINQERDRMSCWKQVSLWASLAESVLSLSQRKVWNCLQIYKVLYIPTPKIGKSTC